MLDRQADTGLISDIVNSLTSPGSPPVTADEWHRIAAWAVIGWRASWDDTTGDQPVVGLLADALDSLDGRHDTTSSPPPPAPG